MKEQILSLSLLILVSLTTMMLWKFFSADVVQILNTYCSQHFLFCRSLDSRGFLGFFWVAHIKMTNQKKISERGRDKSFAHSE